jgi:hypothetical protein
LKAYRIYILGQLYVVFRWDVIFEEDLYFSRFVDSIIGGEEQEALNFEECIV